MKKRPNILVFMTDQQHHATVGQGSPCLTPHLDRLISGGVLFQNAFCPSPICTPSRSSFQTGLFPHQHKQVHNIHYGKNLHLNEEFPEKTLLLGDALLAEGYSTAYVGKWDSGLKKCPRDHGYQIYDHNPGGAQPSRIDLYDTVSIPGESDTVRAVISAATTQRPEDSSPFRVAAKAVERIREMSRNPEKPFYLFTSTVAPHVPWHCPEAYAHLHDPADIPEPANYRDEFHHKPAAYLRHYNQHNYCRPQLAWPEMARAISHYYGIISLIDAAFGLMLAALRDCGVLDDTIVVFTSDHGEFQGGHGLLGKDDNLLDDIIRTPLVFSYPGHFGPAVRPEFVNLTDVFATLVSLTGAGAPVPAVSRDLSPLLTGGRRPEAFPDVAFCEHNGAGSFNTVRGIRTADFKYVFRPHDAMDELYDMKNDPGEMINLIHAPAHREVIRELRGRLLQWMTDTGDMAARGAAAMFSRQP